MNRPQYPKIGLPISGYTAVTVSAESVTVPAGAIGSVVDFYFLKKPIADSNGCYIGGNGDSSISFTSLIFDTEVSYKEDADLENGEYWIDYIRGRGRGKKANSGTSLSANYKVFQKL